MIELSFQTQIAKIMGARSLDLNIFEVGIPFFNSSLSQPIQVTDQPINQRIQ